MTDPASRPIVAALSTHSKPDSGSLLILAVFVAALVYFLRAQKHPPFPPGPRKLPLIGNLLDVPLQDQWVTFSRMAKEASTYIMFEGLTGNQRQSNLWSCRYRHTSPQHGRNIDYRSGVSGGYNGTFGSEVGNLFQPVRALTTNLLIYLWVLIYQPSRPTSKVINELYLQTSLLS